jgi:hypothetical protein
MFGVIFLIILLLGGLGLSKIKIMPQKVNNKLRIKLARNATFCIIFVSNQYCHV